MFLKEEPKEDSRLGDKGRKGMPKALKRWCWRTTQRGQMSRALQSVLKFSIHPRTNEKKLLWQYLYFESINSRIEIPGVNNYRCERLNEVVEKNRWLEWEGNAEDEENQDTRHIQMAKSIGFHKKRRRKHGRNLTSFNSYRKGWKHRKRTLFFPWEDRSYISIMSTWYNSQIQNGFVWQCPTVWNYNTPVSAVYGLTDKMSNFHM